MKTGIIALCSVLLISTVGCCGILPGPSNEAVKSRLDAINGHPVKDAILLLKSSGFEIKAGDPPSPPWNVIATRNCGPGTGFTGVYVHADGEGKIVGSDVWGP